MIKASISASYLLWMAHLREVLLVPEEEHRKDMITVLYKQIYAVTKTKHAILLMFFLLIND